MKLRNRLGNQTLTSLAKLKMHIQDEHLHTGETKKHIKCLFGKASVVSLEQAVSQQPIVPAPLLINETETDNTMVIDLTLQQSLDGFANESDQFNKLALSFGRQAAGDDNDGDGQMPLKISIKIVDLFNFMNTGWISVHKCSTSQSLDEELELYKLLDTDAPGHNNINVKIDAVLDSVLHNV